MVFEKTSVNIFAYDFSKIHPDDAGSVLLGQCRLRHELVAVGLLGTLKSSNARPLFNMLAQLPPKVAVFGGGADTYQADGVSYVFTYGALLKRGILAVCFDPLDRHEHIFLHVTARIRTGSVQTAVRTVESVHKEIRRAAVLQDILISGEVLIHMMLTLHLTYESIFAKHQFADVDRVKTIHIL